MECRVAYTDLRTCLINVPGTLLGAISKPVQQCLVEVRASAPNGPVVVAGLSGFSSVAADESTVEIDAGFARANQLDDGSLVTCRISEAVPRATSIHVAPRTPDDWELMEMNSGFLEGCLLGQLRAVKVGALCVVYVGTNIVNIVVTRVDTEDAAEYLEGACLYGGDSEVIVAPMARQVSSKAPPSHSASGHPKAAAFMERVRAINSDTQPAFAREDCRIAVWVHPLLRSKGLFGRHASVATIPQSDDGKPTAPDEEKKSNANGTAKEDPRVFVTRVYSDDAVPYGHCLLSASLSRLLGERTGSSIMLSSAPSQGKPASAVTFAPAASIEAKPTCEQVQAILTPLLDGPITNGQIYADANVRGIVSWRSKFVWATFATMPEIEIAPQDVIPVIPAQSRRECIEHGLTELVDAVMDIVDNGKHALVAGRPGSGKTNLLKCIQNRAEDELRYCAVIECKKLGNERVPAVRDLISSTVRTLIGNIPSVLLLDDMDSLFSAESENQDQTRTRVLSELFSEDVLQLPSGISVVGFCSAKSSLHASFSTKFIFWDTVSLKPPSRESRASILRGYMEKLGADASVVDADRLAIDLEGYLPRDIISLCDKAYFEHLIRLAKAGNDDGPLEEEDFRTCMTSFKPSSLQGVNSLKPSVTWKDVGGMTETKSILLETLEWPTKYAPIFANCPLRLRSGILLYGYPGCGKSLIAAAVAAQSGLNFISIKGPEILNKYIGASEQSVRELFERASSAKPCILFLDEFESIAPKRGHDSTGVTDRVVNQLLTQMDGAEGLDGVYVLAATSRPDLIDAALLRPGRLDKAVLCDMPSYEDRLSIISALAPRMRFHPEVDFSQIASETAGFSGADLQALLYNAHLAAIHDYTKDSVEKEKGPSASDNILEPSIASKTFTFTLGQDPEETAEAFERHIESLAASAKELHLPSSPGPCQRQQVEIEICSHHIALALNDTNPSVSAKEFKRLYDIYSHFVSQRSGEMPNGIPSSEVGGRTTLM